MEGLSWGTETPPQVRTEAGGEGRVVWAHGLGVSHGLVVYISGAQSEAPKNKNETVDSRVWVLGLGSSRSLGQRGSGFGD